MQTAGAPRLAGWEFVPACHTQVVHSERCSKEGSSMRLTTTWGIRVSVRMGLALVILLGLGVPAWALGPAAPPRILDAGVFIDRISSGTFRLLANVDVEIPGGRVPDNVQSVTVAVPGQGTFNVPFGVGDLTPQTNYFSNLTSAGVAGFPQGTYTITVTDTAGGVTTATDALSSSTGIPTATGLALSGTTAVPGAFELELDLAGTPGPTLTWNAVPGAVFYRARLRNSLNE